VKGAWLVAAVALHAWAWAGLFVTLLPLVRHGSWLIRLWDFPRLQVLQLGAIGLVAAMLAWWLGPRSWSWAVVAGVFVGVMLIQGAQIVRYTPVWPVSVEPAESRVVRLAVMNLDKHNERHAEVAALIGELGPDLLLLIEIDRSWADGLSETAELFEHRIEDVESDGLGIALWSRLELRDIEKQELVSEKRTSIHGRAVLPDGREVELVGLHPTPPGYSPPDDEERYDSRIRDAELVTVAERIAEEREAGRAETWIVAGDMNDVAWSHTTRLFRRLSGLVDPRIGRGMFNTYHARLPWLRFPVDHVFVTDDLGIVDMRRVTIPGSDHFGVVADFGWSRPDGDAARRPDEEDLDEAAEMVEEGTEDAAEAGEQAR